MNIINEYKGFVINKYTDKMIRDCEREEIIKNFPKIELSYESIGHNKVYDYILCIPEGKKYFAWFTTYKMQNVCFLMEINTETKQFVKIEYGVCSFHEHLSFGTLFYGTIFKYENTRFFSLEDIYYYKGKEVHSKKYSAKLEIAKEIFNNDIKQVSYYEWQMVFGLPVMDNNYQNILNIAGILPYKIKYLQFRREFPKSPIINSVYYKLNLGERRYMTGTENHKGQMKDMVFNVKPEIQSDIYGLYAYNHDTKKCDYYCEVACIPDYKTSVMMNKLFRIIKENNNLDALEESDDEEEFENQDIDKYVHLDKEYNMICSYNYKHKKWTPMRLAPRGERVANKNDLFRLEKNKDVYI